MKLKLTVNERFLLIGILNQFKGDLDKLAKILEDLKLLPLSEEEAEKVGLKTENDRVTWHKDQEKEKEIELSSQAIDFVKKFIADKNAKGEFTLAYSSIIELNKKLS